MTGLNAKTVVTESNKHRQEPLEAGTYPTRLVQVIDLGVQEQPPYQGKEKTPKQMVWTTYEFSDEFCVNEEGVVEEDRPRWISESFPLHNLDVDRAKSSQRYYALDPTEKMEGEWPSLVTTPCMLTVITKDGRGKNSGKVYNNIASISAMRPKQAAKMDELKNEPVVFLLSDPDIDVFMKLPQFLQGIIKENLNYDGSALHEAVMSYKKPDDEGGSDSDTNEDVGKKEKDSDGDW